MRLVRYSSRLSPRCYYRGKVTRQFHMLGLAGNLLCNSSGQYMWFRLDVSRVCQLRHGLQPTEKFYITRSLDSKTLSLILLDLEGTGDTVRDMLLWCHMLRSHLD
jgi:VCBS repeat-containing protein